MIRYNSLENQLQIIIANSGLEELYRYQKGLLSILSTIEVESCSPDLREDIKAVYSLLSHLLLDKAFQSEHKNLLQEFSHRDALMKI